MSMNKYMHPRNIYRKPPDFEQLAIMYDDFRNITKMNLNGKIYLDFKDEAALRILTQCLLKKDFGLDVLLPPKQLVPTLPLRLNYIHWIEDIVQTFSFKDVTGIDIGCGASCIYPLLAVQQNSSWSMFATELNVESIGFARENIQRNGFNDRITIIKDCGEDNPFACLNELQKIDFTMCNPPFFSDDHDLDSENNEDQQSKPFKNRTGKRKAAKSAQTGIKCELSTAGGEVEFVRKMIQQSHGLSDKVNVFTTMLGHKSSENQILNELKMSNITNFCSAEFCQGRTTRWAIAWTFRNDLLLRTVPVIGQTKTKPPLYFSPDNISDAEAAIQHLYQILKGLSDAEIFNESVIGSAHYFHFVAHSNSWSKQRQKRREAIRNKNLDDNTEEDEMEGTQEKRRKISETDGGIESIAATVSTAGNSAKLENVKSTFTTPLLHIEVSVTSKKVDDFETTIGIGLKYLNGTAGVNGVHEILQFIRNKWKTS